VPSTQDRVADSLKSVAPPRVRRQLELVGVLLLAVVLDRDPELRVRRVGTGNESTRRIEDLVLDHGFRKTVLAESLEQHRFHLAVCRPTRGIPAFEDLAQRADAPESAACVAIEHFLRRFVGDQSLPASGLDDEFEEGRARVARREVKQRALRRGYRDSIDETDVAGIQPSALVHYETSVNSPLPSDASELDDVAGAAGDLIASGRGPVRGCRPVAGNHERGPKLRAPRRRRT
jgi:hypothetical protein